MVCQQTRVLIGNSYPSPKPIPAITPGFNLLLAVFIGPAKFERQILANFPTQVGCNSEVIGIYPCRTFFAGSIIAKLAVAGDFLTQSILQGHPYVLSVNAPRIDRIIVLFPRVDDRGKTLSPVIIEFKVKDKSAVFPGFLFFDQLINKRTLGTYIRIKREPDILHSVPGPGKAISGTKDKVCRIT